MRAAPPPLAGLAAVSPPAPLALAVPVRWRPLAPVGASLSPSASRRLVANCPDIADAPAPVVIGLRGLPDRPSARRAIRLAILDELALLSGLPPERIALHTPPGEAPHALLDTDAGPRRAAIAISHEGEVSVAAMSLRGAVGIDLVRVAAIPDWAAVARDYLGPTLAARLAALPDAERAPAFARAWSEREARLKCLGRPLAEWAARDEAASMGCRCAPLDLAPLLSHAWVGSLAHIPAPAEA